MVEPTEILNSYYSTCYSNDRESGDGWNINLIVIPFFILGFLFFYRSNRNTKMKMEQTVEELKASNEKILALKGEVNSRRKENDKLRRDILSAESVLAKIILIYESAKQKRLGL
ncbi:MAG: hypothetical protein VX777_10360 [Chlamydiota bacterium]|nr:hypothetical protein [Chlamydiota bacterium]